MYNFKDIRSIHLEITSHCNANCPMCSRNMNGGAVNPFIELTHLSLESVKKIFNKNFVSQLNNILFCGNFGDPIMAPDLIAVLSYFKENNPAIKLKLITNGSAQTKMWWQNIAKLTSEVCFSIDGLEDTNSIYRKGTNFKKIISNARAYIGAGGVARWDYIVFKHNEHQVDEARKLSQKLGFKSFVPKKTGRFYSIMSSEVKEKKAVENRQGEVEYYLEMPKNPVYRNESLSKEKELKKIFGSLKNYFQETPIACKVQKQKSIYVSAQGLIFPCCWLGAEPYKNWWKTNADNQLTRIFESDNINFDSLNALKNDIDDIVSGQIFQETIPKYWSVDNKNKLKTCSRICGQQFNQFNDQYKS